MRQCYDMFYRPENMSVIVTGTLKDTEHVLETLHEYQKDFKETVRNL
jgi:predicted Zn-dependent peptidase